jgi:rhamnose transport system permease protein
MSSGVVGLKRRFARRPPPAYLGLPGWNLGLLALIVLVFIWGSVTSSDFLDTSQLLAAGQAQATTALLALGLCLVVIVGEIDISLTSNLALCTVVAGILAEHGGSVVVIVLATLATGVALGAVNGVLVAAAGMPSLAVTLGTMGAFQGAAFLIGGNTGYTKFPPAISDIGNGYVGEVPIALIVVAGLAVLFSLLLGLTGLGRAWYAIGRASEVVRRSGWSVVGPKLVAFLLACFSAGVAALVFVGYYGSGGGDSASGTILLVVTAVALGGLDIYGGSGRITGVVLALVLLAALQDAMGLINVSTTIQTIVIGALLIVSLAVSNALGGGHWLRRLRTSLSHTTAKENRDG